MKSFSSQISHLFPRPLPPLFISPLFVEGPPGTLCWQSPALPSEGQSTDELETRSLWCFSHMENTGPSFFCLDAASRNLHGAV